MRRFVDPEGEFLFVAAEQDLYEQRAARPVRV
ncbi:MAG: hypothetical protein ABIR79_15490 [Candidatus Binatia bacterium]